jgi:hypothetical protein
LVIRDAIGSGAESVLPVLARLDQVIEGRDHSW